MSPIKNYSPLRGNLLLILIFLNALILKEGYIYNARFYFLLFVTLPLLAICVYYVQPKKKAKDRSNPLVKGGDGRLWIKKTSATWYRIAKESAWKDIKDLLKRLDK